MNGLEERFLRARRRGKTLFIPFLTGGYPDIEKSKRVLEAVAEAGVEVIELGIPFSDPIADGVTIQEANARALMAGATPVKVLEIAGHITSRYDVSVVILSYLNPVYRIGMNRFMERARAMGVEGLIVPDLPLEEARLVRPIAERYEMSLVLLAAPTTSDVRLAQILDESMGFTYLVSLKGTTGEREEIPPTAEQLLLRAKGIRPDKPVAVGFGISSPVQASRLGALGADGIIVGSRLISEIKRSGDEPEDAVKALVQSFLRGLGGRG